MKQDFQSRAGTPLSAHAGTKSPLGSNELVSHTHRPGAQGMFQPRFGGVGAMPLDGPQMQEFGHIYEMARQEGFNASEYISHLSWAPPVSGA